MIYENSQSGDQAAGQSQLPAPPDMSVPPPGIPPQSAPSPTAPHPMHPPGKSFDIGKGSPHYGAPYKSGKGDHAPKGEYKGKGRKEGSYSKSSHWDDSSHSWQPNPPPSPASSGWWTSNPWERAASAWGHPKGWDGKSSGWEGHSPDRRERREAYSGATTEYGESDRGSADGRSASDYDPSSYVDGDSSRLRREYDDDRDYIDSRYPSEYRSDRRDSRYHDRDPRRSDRRDDRRRDRDHDYDDRSSGGDRKYRRGPDDRDRYRRR